MRTLSPSRSTDISNFTDRQAERIAEIAETHSWQLAAHDYMRRANHRAYRLAIDEYASQIRFLLPLTKQSRVLNLPSGWGSVAFNLATHVAFVVAVDHRSTRSRFVSARQKQTGTEALHPVCGAVAPNLPFSDETFDAVLMPEATEGLGTSGIRGGKAAQAAALTEVRRVLRTGGWALMGVANRLGIARPDCAGAGYNRSFRGYRRAVEKAGFSHVQLYASLPSHREPFFIFPFDQPQLLNYFINRMFAAEDYRGKLAARGLGLAYHFALRLRKLAAHLHMTRLACYFLPSYLIIGQK